MNFLRTWAQQCASVMPGPLNQRGGRHAQLSCKARDGPTGGPGVAGNGRDLAAEIFGIANLTRGPASAEGTNTELELGNAIVHRSASSRWRHNAREPTSDARRGRARYYESPTTGVSFSNQDGIATRLYLFRRHTVFTACQRGFTARR